LGGERKSKFFENFMFAIVLVCETQFEGGLRVFLGFRGKHGEQSFAVTILEHYQNAL
jgi:hypothetical protein